MSEASKKSRRKRKLPKNVEELTDDQVAKKLFGSEAVKEMNKIIDHSPPK